MDGACHPQTYAMTGIPSLFSNNTNLLTIATEEARADYLWCQETDKKLLKRINTLIKEILRTPLEGIGKPEPLKANLSGYWSRLINTEHRLVYEVSEDSKQIHIINYTSKPVRLRPEGAQPYGLG